MFALYTDIQRYAEFWGSFDQHAAQPVQEEKHWKQSPILQWEAPHTFPHTNAFPERWLEY